MSCPTSLDEVFFLMAGSGCRLGVEFLLHKGASPTSYRDPESGLTAAEVAAKNKKTTCLNLILDKELEVARERKSACKKKKVTWTHPYPLDEVLFIMTRARYHIWVEFLLHKGASPTRYRDPDSGLTAVEFAAKYKLTPCLNVFVGKGLEVPREKLKPSRKKVTWAYPLEDHRTYPVEDHQDPSPPTYPRLQKRSFISSAAIRIR